MTMTTTPAIEDRDDGLPTTIPAFEVARMFRQADLVTYGDARREFFIQANLNPFKTRTPAFHKTMEDAFEQWFAFDYHLGVDGRTPFATLAESLHEEGGWVKEREYRDMCETEETNLASWFWIRRADASEPCIELEDLVNGGIYEVRNASLAARYDGACGGTLVLRIAKTRGVWRVLCAPLYESPLPNDERARVATGAALRTWGPRFADLVRLLFGRDPRMNLDWADMAAVAR